MASNPVPASAAAASRAERSMAQKIFKFILIRFVFLCKICCESRCFSANLRFVLGCQCSFLIGARSCREQRSVASVVDTVLVQDQAAGIDPSLIVCSSCTLSLRSPQGDCVIAGGIKESSRVLVASPQRRFVVMVTTRRSFFHHSAEVPSWRGVQCVLRGGIRDPPFFCTFRTSAPGSADGPEPGAGGLASVDQTDAGPWIPALA